VMHTSTSSVQCSRPKNGFSGASTLVPVTFDRTQFFLLTFVVMMLEVVFFKMAFHAMIFYITTFVLMTLALTIFLHMTLVIMLREQMWWRQVQTFFL
jgi:hypothetical protein